MFNDSIQFQLYDWTEDHDVLDIDNDDDNEQTMGDYIIHAFGRREDGKSVYAKITGYTPYFYILLPPTVQSKSKKEIDLMLKSMTKYFKGYGPNSKENRFIAKRFKQSLVEIQTVKLKRAEGFTKNFGLQDWFFQITML